MRLCSPYHEQVTIPRRLYSVIVNPRISSSRFSKPKLFVQWNRFRRRFQVSFELLFVGLLETPSHHLRARTSALIYWICGQHFEIYSIFQRNAWKPWQLLTPMSPVSHQSFVSSGPLTERLIAESLVRAFRPFWQAGIRLLTRVGGFPLAESDDVLGLA